MFVQYVRGSLSGEGESRVDPLEHEGVDLLDFWFLPDAMPHVLIKGNIFVLF